MFNTRKTRNRILTDFYQQMSALGSTPIFIIIIFIFLLNKQFETAFFLSLGLIVLYAIAAPLRLMFFKERPIPKPYENIFEKIDASSVPSLHAARVGFLLLFLMDYFATEIYTFIFLIVVSLLIVYSRIYRKRHYFADVVIGFILGVFVYQITYQFLRFLLY